MKIKNCFKNGEPKNPFLILNDIFKCIFYNKNSLLIEGNGGYIILSGSNYEDVKNRIIKESETIISKNFELYEGN
jgi:hypothetical protein